MAGNEGLFGSEVVHRAASEARGARAGRGGGPEWVTDGAGGREPFDPERLRSSVARAARSAEREDPALVDEVCDIVAFALARECAASGGRVVAKESVGWVTERTLVELGQARVVKAFILGRDRRGPDRREQDRREQDLAVRASGPVGAGSGGTARREAGSDGAARGLTVRTSAGSGPFDRARLERALIVDSGLAEEDAAAVAGRVEEVLGGTLGGGFGATGLAEVSGRLVREVLRQVLGELGFTEAWHWLGEVGRPTRELEAALEGERAAPLDGAGPSAREARAACAPADLHMGAALIREWTLGDGLPRRCAEAHLRADLHVLGAGAPHRDLARAVPCELLAGGSAWSRAEAFALTRRSAAALLEVEGALVLEGAAGAIAAAVEPGGGSFERREAPVVDLLQGLGATALASGRDLGFARFGGKRGVTAGRLLRSLARAVEAGGAALRLFATLPEVEDALGAVPPGEPRERTREAVERLLGSGHLVPVWAPEGARWVAPGCHRRRRDRGVLAAGTAVAINLPRLARAAGPWREDRFLELLVDRVAAAVEATAALTALRPQASRGGLQPSRRVGLLVPVGLQEALEILGDGVRRAGQGAQALGLARDAAARLGAMADLRLEVSGAFQGSAARRFAAADLACSGPSQGRLFGDLPRPEAQGSIAYGGLVPGLGGELPGDAEARARRARAVAAALETSPAGGLFPDPGDGTGGSGREFDAGMAGLGVEADPAETPRFDLWRRIWTHRGSGVEGASSVAENSLF